MRNIEFGLYAVKTDVTKRAGQHYAALPLLFITFSKAESCGTLLIQRLDAAIPGIKVNPELVCDPICGQITPVIKLHE